jgi:hypothetical protein
MMTVIALKLPSALADLAIGIEPVFRLLGVKEGRGGHLP